MDWSLFHIPYVFEHPDGTMTFKDRKMSVNMKQCGFYGGVLSGIIDLDLRKNPSDYVVSLALDKVDFQRFMVRTFNYSKSTGVLDATGHFAGALGLTHTMTGKGDAHVDDGDITGIPLLGSLTPLIPGFSAADAAHGHFTIGDGFIRTDDLNITSETLALIGEGNYNFIADKLDLNMRVNTRIPLFGLLTYPVSKILEFHADGSMKNPQWSARNF